MVRSDYAAAAAGRARAVWQRIGFSLFIGVAAWVFTGGWEPLAWIGAVAVCQMVDRAICLRVARCAPGEPSTRLLVLFTSSLAFSATLFSSISILLLLRGGIASAAFAMLLPAGAVLAMAVQAGNARGALMAGWAPHALFLLGLPLIYGLVSAQSHLLEMTFLSFGGALFLVHVLLAVLQIQRSDSALRTALQQADDHRERAERASAAKSDFLTTMSHEIRTPMNAVVAAAQLLKGSPLRTDQREYVDILSNAAEMLMGLLNDVLDIAKIESGKIVLESVDVDLRQKLELGAQLWRPRAALKGLALELNLGDLPSRVVTDPLRLQQILFNLLSNALKFTDRGGIQFRAGRCEAAPDRLWFEVEDTGCGMDAATAVRVFDSFEQACAQTARQYGGTGLGLAISRRLAEMLGGSLTVRSQPGVGSTFRLEIPLAEPVALDDPAADAGAAETTREPTGVQLLLAEDHAVNQRIVRLMLEPLGFELTVVADGAQAVTAAQERPFDVILMDMQMPVMDGVAATLAIRAGAGPNRMTPVVALTANALAEHRAQWAQAGVDRFVAKPVDMATLVAAVMDAVSAGAGDEERAADAA